MDDEDIEHTLYVNRDVKVYRIPPRPAAGGHSSGTWRVDDCIFTGRLRVMAKGAAAEIRLEDGSTGELFALCPFTPATQAVVIEATVDSSRYYVLRVEDPSTRRHAFLGIGFSDRGAAFDFNAALADHAKQCQRESIVAAHATAASSGSGNAPTTAAAAGPGGSSWQDPAFAALYKDPGDLSLKEGQTIRIDVKRPPSRGSGGGFLTRSSDGSSGSGSGRHSSGGGSTPVLLPPPVLSPPPGQPQQLSSSQTHHAGPTAAAALAPATATAAAGRMAVAAPAAGTVASTEENWATFD